MANTLVDADWIANHQNDPNVRLIEINRDGVESYNQGHIPGAIGWNWKTMLWDPYQRQFPSAEDFARRLEIAGISHETLVVLYGVPVQFGTYARWVFKYCGHENVRILDGGKVRWQSDGRPLTQDIPEIDRTDYPPISRNELVRASRKEVLRAIESAEVCLLDHRSGEEYSGQRVSPPGMADVGAECYGRIPGALHVPFDSLLEADETFKSESALREIFAAAAPDCDQAIISYCRLSHRATLASFVMTEILGYTNVKVYDGSWTEWGSMVGLPIER